MGDVYRSPVYSGGQQYAQKLGRGLNLRPTDKMYLAGPASKSGVMSPMILVVTVVTLVAVTAVTIGLSVYFSTKTDDSSTMAATTSSMLTTLAQIATDEETTVVDMKTTATQPSATTEAVVMSTQAQPEATVEATTTESPVTAGPTTDQPVSEMQTTESPTTEGSTAGNPTTAPDVVTTTLDVTDEVTSTTEVMTTTAPQDVLGAWSEWNDWGDCDVTCGGGLQRRSRDCEGGQEGFYCVGAVTESQRCNTLACPFVVTAGTWFSWSSWTSCTMSCGGGAQVRSRVCDRGDLNLDCVGDDSQTSTCSQYLCPDCSQVCTSGTLDASCTRCECQGEFEGVVQTTAGVALNAVEIFHSDVPYEVIFTTGPSGNYSLQGLCVSHQITFQKEGFTSVTYSADWLPNVVQLEQTEQLVMDVHPTSKKRVVGDDVLFCCAAIGNPLPEYYEWFKNDVQIPGESGSTLSLTSVTLDSAGTYHCRANTDNRGVASIGAVLTVKENADDFCPDSPDSKLQQLPSGCSVNGSSVINVGQCDSIRCRGNSVSNQSCGEGEMFCCAATQYVSEDIACEGFTYTALKTAACGCSQCTEPVLDIKGFVFAASDNTPLNNVAIYYNKTRVTNTASNGQFYFSVAEGTRTVAVTARSPSRTEYADTTAVINLEEDADGVFYVSIKLPAVTQLPGIDSVTDQTLAINTEAGTHLVDVNVPANSFYDENGNLYQGTVTPYVSVIDASDRKQLESAPGDFTTTGSEGDIDKLQTYGMLQLAFYADDGSKLQVVNEVQLDIPSSVLGDVDESNSPGSSNPLSAIKLYVFNENSGLWEELASVEVGSASRRRKRQSSYYSVNITGIASTQPWFNFDAVSTTTCLSKIRIYENENFLANDQIRQVKMYAFIKGNDNTYSYSTRIAYNNNDRQGYCLVHRCDSPRNGNVQLGFQGFLVAERDGKYLVPAVNDTGIDDLVSTLNYTALEDKIHVQYNLTAVPDAMGPFYDWDRKWIYSPACINAPISHRHFRFHLHEEDQCYQFQGFQFRDTLTETCKPHYYKSWHSAPEIRAQQYTTCYVRVKIAQYTNDVKVQALSQVGTMQYNSSVESINPFDVYGYHENCTVGGVVCSKVKPPGTRGCSHNTQHDLQDQFTYVSITAWYQGGGDALNASLVNSDLNATFSVEAFGPVFAFEMNSSGSIGGIFCETMSGSSPTESDIAAYNSCIDADDGDFAVQFGTSLDCFGEIIVLLNANIQSDQESSSLEWVQAIAENFPIGSENVRVSLTLLNDRSNNTLWNLTSQYTSSNERLFAAVNDLPRDEAQNGSVYLAQSNTTVNAVLEDARDDIKIILVVFDYEWTISQFNATALDKEVQFLKVIPYDNKEEQFRSNSTAVDPDPDLLVQNQNTTAQFIAVLMERIDCNVP